MGIARTTVQSGAHLADHFTLTNAHGMQIELTNWGASLVDVRTADRHGVIESVTLAHRDWAAYASNAPFFGSTIGRVAGRIAHGRFHLDGVDYQLPVQAQHGGHHLHGGAQAMWQKLWQVESCSAQAVVFSYVSADGENGYPAELTLRVCYELNDANQLTVTYESSNDAPTLCNPTNHAYFNLSGYARRTIHEHTLQVSARAVCEMDGNLLVTGGEWPIEQTDFDFRLAKALKQALHSSDPRLQLAQGIDHYFILNDGADDANAPQVTLHDPHSGRRVRVTTDCPCVVLYAHNHASGEPLRHGAVGVQHDALCIETQKLPHIKGVHDDHPAAQYPCASRMSKTVFAFDVL